MFGPEYFTVGGYMVDGGILCRACGEKRDLPASARRDRHTSGERVMTAACKGCGKKTTNKLYLVWGYCLDCSDVPLKPLDGDSYDDAWQDNNGGEG